MLYPLRRFALLLVGAALLAAPLIFGQSPMAAQQKTTTAINVTNHHL